MTTTITFEQKLALLKTAGMEKEALFGSLGLLGAGALGGGLLSKYKHVLSPGVRAAGSTALNLAEKVPGAAWGGAKAVGGGLKNLAQMNTPTSRILLPLIAGAGIGGLGYAAGGPMGAAGALALGAGGLGSLAHVSRQKHLFGEAQRLGKGFQDLESLAHAKGMKWLGKMDEKELESLFDVMRKERGIDAAGKPLQGEALSQFHNKLDSLRSAFANPTQLPAAFSAYAPSTDPGMLGSLARYIKGPGHAEEALQSSGYRALQDVATKRYLEMPRTMPEDKSMGNFSKAMLGLAGIHAAPKILPWGRSEED